MYTVYYLTCSPSCYLQPQRTGQHFQMDGEPWVLNAPCTATITQPLTCNILTFPAADGVCFEQSESSICKQSRRFHGFRTESLVMVGCAFLVLLVNTPWISLDCLWFTPLQVGSSTPHIKLIRTSPAASDVNLGRDETCICVKTPAYTSPLLELRFFGMKHATDMLDKTPTSTRMHHMCLRVGDHEMKPCLPRRMALRIATPSSVFRFHFPLQCFGYNCKGWGWSVLKFINVFSPCFVIIYYSFFFPFPTSRPLG